MGLVGCGAGTPWLSPPVPRGETLAPGLVSPQIIPGRGVISAEMPNYSVITIRSLSRHKAEFVFSSDDFAGWVT